MPESGESEINTSEYDRWHFYPYEDAEEYSEDSPLYAFVAGIENRGEIMIYVRPPNSGAFHSADPDHADITPIPPTNRLKDALVTLLKNPGEDQDLSPLLAELTPWEHHFIEIVMTAIDVSPEKVPPEIWEFLDRCVDDRMGFDFEEDESNHPHGGTVEEILNDDEPGGPRL